VPKSVTVVFACVGADSGADDPLLLSSPEVNSASSPTTAVISAAAPVRIPGSVVQKAKKLPFPLGADGGRESAMAAFEHKSSAQSVPWAV
jgi:hypothetical protein